MEAQSEVAPMPVAASLEFVSALAGGLRRRRVAVSVVQIIDAVRALAVIDRSDERQVRVAMGATLVKRQQDVPALEAALASLAFRRPETPQGVVPEGDLQDELLSALQRDDGPAMRSLVGQAVDVFGGLDEQQKARARYHVHRTLRQLDLSRLLARALADQAEPDEPTLLALQARLAGLETMVADEVNYRLAGEDGVNQDLDALASVEFLKASPAELNRLREIVRPLARRLAVRLARRQSRERKQNRVEMRRTIRRSLGTGGVPVQLAYQRAPRRKPDLVVLADLSGSVAEFARFFLLLLHALHEELPRVRSFCFVDDVDEITHLLESLPDSLEIRHLLTTTSIVGDTGHSDYGAVFTGFAGRFRDALGPRTTVLIAGDGRCNGKDPAIGSLAVIKDRTRRLYWLNPEPRSLWDTRDSVIGRYAETCDAVVEVRNVDQLTEFILNLT